MTERDEWTPSTEQVRSHYVFDQSNRWDPERGDAFDRWLAAHDEAVRQEERDRVTPIVVANERSLLEEAHVECVMYADDVAEGVDVPDDYERHYCETDGEDWPCAHARYEARIRQEERERCARIVDNAMTEVGYTPGPGETAVANPPIRRMSDVAARIREGWEQDR